MATIAFDLLRFMKLRIYLTVSLLSTITLTSPAVAENVEHTRQLLSTKQCPNCDLISAGLVLADLVGADLRGANLTNANLSRANLTGADLSGANLTGASLYGANLTGANLSDTNLRGTDLRGAYLMNAIVSQTNIQEAQLIGVTGLPSNTGSAEDFYYWGIEELRVGNSVNAINFYNQALRLNPDLAAAYFARSMARADLGDLTGALKDAKLAQDLYSSLGSDEGEQIALQLVELLEFQLNPEENKSRGGFLGVLESAAPMLLRLLF